MLVARAIICVTFILSGLAYERSVVAQELSPAILQAIPGVTEKLHSQDINDRISVLDQLVTSQKHSDLIEVVLPFNLPASDYLAVVRSILAGNLAQVDETRASATWWKLTHVVSVFKLNEVVKPLAGYLPESTPSVQLFILRALRTLQSLESVPQIVMLLQSPQEKIRREALDTLVNLRAKEAVPALVAILRSDPGKRYYAMTSLVTVNGREAAADVAKIIDDQDENDRYWALDTLVKLNARDQVQAIWKLTEAKLPQTQRYALAALVYFGERRAIPLAVKKATDGDVSRRGEMLNHLVTLKPTAIVPALIAVLESQTVLGDNPNDAGTDSNIRRDLMTCLGQLKAREAIPVLRTYARGRDNNTFLQRAAVMTLGVLRAGESVNDLLELLDQPITDEYATAEVGVALAQIGEPRTFRKLIELAARPTCPYRSEIINELNRHLDRELWERIQTQKVHSLGMQSVKTTVEAFDRETGIRIMLNYQPSRDPLPRELGAADGYPWANTGGGYITLSYGLQQIVEGLSNYRTPRTHTLILDDKQIRIVSVEQAVEWWRKRF